MAIAGHIYEIVHVWWPAFSILHLAIRFGNISLLLDFSSAITHFLFYYYFCFCFFSTMHRRALSVSTQTRTLRIPMKLFLTYHSAA